MRILITNDDGILAPGIQALYRAVADLGDVDVVAPETSQSASSHAISVLKPMVVRRLLVNDEFHGWSVAGRPADCVKLALMELLRDRRPDFVLSGINAGANTGVNVLYSGTVAGALEAAIFNIPAIAFSLELAEEMDFAGAGRIARALFETFVAAAPPTGMCLNVNIPALDRGGPRGVRCCPQAPVNWEEYYERQVDHDGQAVYFLDGRLPGHDGDPEGDLAGLRQGYVTITPLRPNLTARDQLKEIAKWSWPGSF